MLSFQQAVFPLLIGCLIMVVGYPTLTRLPSSWCKWGLLKKHWIPMSAPPHYLDRIQTLSGGLGKKEIVRLPSRSSPSLFHPPVPDFRYMVALWRSPRAQSLRSHLFPSTRFVKFVCPVHSSRVPLVGRAVSGPLPHPPPPSYLQTPRAPSDVDVSRRYRRERRGCRWLICSY